MKYLFFVQSEGRGHLSQALSLAEKLRLEGHEVVGVVANDNPMRKIPEFFLSGIGCHIYFIKSPYFLINKQGTGINFEKSVIFNLNRFKAYAKSLKSIDKLCKDCRPDVIINFYEPLIGLYNLFYKTKIPCFSIGHQFFIEHPSFKRPKGHFKDYKYLNFYNHLISYGSRARLALSFTEEPDYLPKKIITCPPLIRTEVKKLVPKKDNFILSYVLNHGYFEQIKDWCLKHPEQKIEAFWDKKDELDPHHFGDNLTFYPISGQKFLDLLENCLIYISTGGFDSICEAAYLQKNILMVPTKNHYEQLCNAVDAGRANLAVSDVYFNIDLIINKQKTHQDEASRVFKNWVDKEDNKIIKIITSDF